MFGENLVRQRGKRVKGRNEEQRESVVNRVKGKRERKKIHVNNNGVYIKNFLLM